MRSAFALKRYDATAFACIYEGWLAEQRSDWLGHVTVPKGGRSRQLPMTQRLTATFKASRHLRSDRVLCLPDGSAMTRERVIKAVRGAQRVAGVDQGGHILRHTFYSTFALRALVAPRVNDEQGVHILRHTFSTASAAAPLRRDKSR